MFKGPHKPAVIQTHPLPCSPCYLFMIMVSWSVSICITRFVVHRSVEGYEFTLFL